MFVHATSLASAWLIKKGQYRYSSSFANVSGKSLKEKRIRADIYLQMHKKLLNLQQRIKGLDPLSARYKNLANKIKILKKISSDYTAYQDDSFKVFSVEYGINNNQNIGLQILYKEESFKSSQNSSENKKYLANKHDVDLFYKVKLFQKNNFIISFQPKFFFSQRTKDNKQFFYEASLLFGTTKNILGKKNRTTSLFTQVIFSFASQLPSKSHNQHRNKKYYSFSTSEGVKFSNGFMLVNFTKYYIRKKYGLIYNKTLYEQLSIAKEIKFGKLKQNNLTMQIGLFWDQSLIKKDYKISGTIFSIWLDI